MKTMDYDKFCTDILYIDPNIRFAGVFDGDGEMKGGGAREGITVLFTMQELKSSGIQALGRWISRNPDEDKMGKAKFAIVEYEKVRLITMPIDGDILFVSTELESNYVNILSRILRLKAGK
jgi:hypothetical protein